MRTQALLVFGMMSFSGALQIACGSSSVPSSSPKSQTGDMPIEQLSVNTPGDLPACTRSREGQFAYVRETNSLVACTDSHWTPIPLQPGPRGPTGPQGPRGDAGPAGELAQSLDLVLGDQDVGGDHLRLRPRVGGGLFGGGGSRHGAVVLHLGIPSLQVATKLWRD